MFKQIASTREGNGGRSLLIPYLFLVSLLMPYKFYLGSILLSPHRLTLLIVTVPLAIGLIASNERRNILVDGLVVFSVIWISLSLIVNHGVSASVEPAGIAGLELLGAYLVSRHYITSTSDLFRIARFQFLLIMLIMPFAVAESVTQRPLLLELVPGSSVQAVDAGIRLGLRRAQTVFEHPILYGVFVSSTFGLVFCMTRSLILKLSSIIIISISTFVSLSTGALLALLMQMLLVSWDAVFRKFRTRWRVLFILFIVLYVIIDIFSTRSPFHVLVNYATFSSGSAYNRILIWTYGTENVYQNPFFGLGNSDWIRPSWMSSSVDNFWLLMAMKYGIPMLLFLLAAMFVVFLRLGRRVFASEFERGVRNGYLISLTGIVVAGGTVHYWHEMMSYVMFLFGSGVFMAASVSKDRVETHDNGPAVKGPPTYRRNFEKISI